LKSVKVGKAALVVGSCHSHRCSSPPIPIGEA
jgi:hypothetical protein